MEHKEELRILPEDLVLPKYIGIGKRKYESNIGWLITLSYDGKPYIQQTDGYETVFKTPEELFHQAMKYDSIFVFSPENELDILFKLFTKAQLEELDSVNYFRHGKYKVSQYYPTRLDLSWGLKTTSIYNIANMTLARLDTPGKLTDWVAKFNSLQEILDININISSSSASSMSILMNYSHNIHREFLRIRDLDYKSLQLVYSSIHNTWMEPDILGISEDMENVDLIKAHLRAFANIPACSRHYSSLSTKPDYREDDLMGWYTIKTTVPNEGRFGDIPYRYNNIKVVAPHGTFTTILPKPYLDYLTREHRNFKVLQAVRFRPTSGQEVTYPARAHSRIMEKIIDGYEEELFPLNLKTIVYKTLIGYMQHSHESIENSDGEEIGPENVIPMASKLFNPGVASTIYGMVNIQINEMIKQSKNPIYRRHDAITRTPEGNNNSNFRSEKIGRLFGYTSIIHDNPGSTTVFDFVSETVKRAPDSCELSLNYEKIPRSRRAAKNNPDHIYDPATYHMELKADFEKRLTPKGLKNAELLEGPVKSKGIPSVDDIPKLLIQRYNQEILENRWLKPKNATKKRR